MIEYLVLGSLPTQWGDFYPVNQEIGLPEFTLSVSGINYIKRSTEGDWVDINLDIEEITEEFAKKIIGDYIRMPTDEISIKQVKGDS